MIIKKLIIETDSRPRVCYWFSKWVLCTGNSKRGAVACLADNKAWTPRLSSHFKVGHRPLYAVAWPPTDLPCRPAGRLVWLQIICWTGRVPLPRHRRRVASSSKSGWCSDVHITSFMQFC